MDTKEAIKWLKSVIDFYNYPASNRIVEQHEAWDNYRKRDDIIELLRRGEKLESIVNHNRIRNKVLEARIKGLKDILKKNKG